MIPRRHDVQLTIGLDWCSVIVMKRLLVAALALLPLSARANCKIGDCVSGVAGDSLFSVMSMHDMEGGRWIFEASPGYVTGKIKGSDIPRESLTVKGVTGAFAVKRELSPNWGVGMLGSFVKQSNENTLTTQSGLAPGNVATSIPGSARAGGTIKDMSSRIIALMLTYDPFSNPDGFRLPLSVGPLYMDQGVEFTHSFSNSGVAQTEKASISRRDLGLFGNASFDFLVAKDFRIMPGVSVGGAPSFLGASNYAKYDYVVERNGTRTLFPYETSFQSFFATIYVQLLYRPWGLGANAIVMSNSDDIKIYSLKLTKKFGGKA